MTHTYQQVGGDGYKLIAISDNGNAGGGSSGFMSGGFTFKHYT